MKKIILVIGIICIQLNAINFKITSNGSFAYNLNVPSETSTSVSFNGRQISSVSALGADKGLPNNQVSMTSGRLNATMRGSNTYNDKSQEINASTNVGSLDPDDEISAQIEFTNYSLLARLIAIDAMQSFNSLYTLFDIDQPVGQQVAELEYNAQSTVSNGQFIIEMDNGSGATCPTEETNGESTKPFPISLVFTTDGSGNLANDVGVVCDA